MMAFEDQNSSSCFLGFPRSGQSSRSAANHQDIDLKYGGAWRRGASALGGLLLPGGGTYRLQDVAVAYGDAPAMPETVSLAVDPRAGSLTVHRDGEVYAFLYRDNEASAAADAQYRAGGA